MPMREFPGRFKGRRKIYSDNGENERPGALSAVWQRNERALGAGERSLLAPRLSREQFGATLMAFGAVTDLSLLLFY